MFFYWLLIVFYKYTKKSKYDFINPLISEIKNELRFFNFSMILKAYANTIKNSL